MTTFGLSQLQSQAILDMQLQRLPGEGQEDRQEERTERGHGYPDKSLPALFPQDFLAT